MSLKDVELKLLQTCNVSNPLSDPRLRVRCRCLLASEHLKIETKIIEHFIWIVSIDYLMTRPTTTPIKIIVKIVPSSTHLSQEFVME